MKIDRIVICIEFIAVIVALFQPIPVHCQTSQSNTLISQSLSTTNILTQDIGDSRFFWEYDFTTQTYYELSANLLAIGQYCYIYMQDSVVALLGESESESRCELYRDEFDTIIYPTVTDLTGNPDGRIGDIDGDIRIIILISENTMSYYSQTNEIESAYSNLCEMVYIYYNTNVVLGTIAHEFCHLIWFNYEFDEVHFILEGLAEYARYYAGYFAPFNNLSSRSRYFLQHPEDSLVYFDIRPKDYGGTYLFTYYLAEQFGMDFLRALVQQEVDGAVGIETSLFQAGHNISFNDLYLDWITALAIDEPGFADGRYGLQTIDARIQEFAVISELPYLNGNLPLSYYGSQVHKLIAPTDSFVVEISGPLTEFIGVSIAFHDVDGWHVQQNQSEGVIMENITGNSIDTAYVISSFLDAHTPSGDIDFGSGPSIEVELTISESSSASESNATGDLVTYEVLWLVGGISLVSIVIVFVTIRLKNLSTNK